MLENLFVLLFLSSLCLPIRGFVQVAACFQYVVHFASQNNTANPAPTVIPQEELDRLYKWNLGLGIFHLITGVIIFIITDKTAFAYAYSVFPGQV